MRSKDGEEMPPPPPAVEEEEDEFEVKKVINN